MLLMFPIVPVFTNPRPQNSIHMCYLVVVLHKVTFLKFCCHHFVTSSISYKNYLQKPSYLAVIYASFLPSWLSLVLFPLLFPLLLSLLSLLLSIYILFKLQYRLPEVRCYHKSTCKLLLVKITPQWTHHLYSNNARRITVVFGCKPDVETLFTLFHLL